MIFTAVAVSPAELSDLRRHPDRVFEVLSPEDGEGPRPPVSVDLDKAWHGLHYLLTGDPWDGDPPLCWAILGGEPIGDDTGYGPPRYLIPDQVAAIASALDRATHDDLLRRFDPVRMAEEQLYPHGWGDDADAGWLLEAFDALAGFYGQAATASHAVLLCLS